MMQGMRDYILGIGAAAVICAITLSFGAKGKMQPLLKLICGLVLTFSVLKPVLAFSHGGIAELGIDYGRIAEDAALAGKELGEQTLRDIIIQETSTYILDKAQAMGLDIQVDIGLDLYGPPVPKEVTIRGRLSPYERQKFSRFLREQLGIEEAQQKWIYQH